MKAMLLEQFGQPLRYGEIPDPIPGYGEVVLDVEACGVCHSDLKIISGMHPNCAQIRLPFIPGHEVVGRVSAAGSGVNGWKIGDRALVSIYMGCTTCDSCRAGMEQLCESDELQIIGFTENGGYAQKMKVRARNLVPISDEIPATEAAVITDAVATCWRAAFEAANIKSGEKALVIGFGGLGVHLAQILNSCGVDVTVCELCKEKVTIAGELGLNQVFCGYAEDLPADKTFHTIFDVTGKITNYNGILSHLKRRGKFVMVGYSVNSPSLFSSAAAHVNELSLIGTRGNSVKNLKDALKMVEMGKIKPIIGAVNSLENANAVLQQLNDGGHICGRFVLIP